MINRCDTCRYYQPKLPEGKRPPQGTCRYNPPTVFPSGAYALGGSAFPEVATDDWCGKWANRTWHSNTPQEV